MSTFITVSFEEAIEKSLQLATTTPTIEWVYLSEALGRVLANDLTCKKDLPAFNNSALDGFGIRFSDVGKKLKIKETIYAGMSIENCSLGENECYKIMTGAEVPTHIDTIVPFEEALDFDEHTALIPSMLKKGNALRFKGEEQKIGSKILEKGSLINSQNIAMLASQGITKIPVYKKISIAVFSTGDELKEPWENANENQIYNINSSALIALLNEHGFQADYCGVIPDNLEESIEYFSKMKRYDVLITSGGISMGEADFTAEALAKNGFNSIFHGINIKPGKPTMMGKMQDTIVCSMPGNPLAAYVNAYLLVIPLCKKLQGLKDFTHQKILCKNAKKFTMKKGRVNIVLGKLKETYFHVTQENKYGSGMITPITQSNCIYLSDEDKNFIDDGELISSYLI